MQRNNGKSRWQQPPGIDRTEVEYRPWPWPDWRPKPNPCVFSQEESHTRCSRRLAELQNQVRSRKALITSCWGCTHGHNSARCYSPRLVWLSGSEYTRRWKYPVRHICWPWPNNIIHLGLVSDLPEGGRGIGGTSENWNSPEKRESSKAVPLQSHSPG